LCRHKKQQALLARLKQKKKKKEGRKKYKIRVRETREKGNWLGAISEELWQPCLSLSGINGFLARSLRLAT